MQQDLPQCYGKMFPDLMTCRINQPCSGAVFSTQLNSVGIGIQSSQVQVDREKWSECLKCSDYRHCYDLSLGTFLVQQAVWQK